MTQTPTIVVAGPSVDDLVFPCLWPKILWQTGWAWEKMHLTPAVFCSFKWTPTSLAEHLRTEHIPSWSWSGRQMSPWTDGLWTWTSAVVVETSFKCTPLWSTTSFHQSCLWRLALSCTSNGQDQMPTITTMRATVVLAQTDPTWFRSSHGLRRFRCPWRSRRFSLMPRQTPMIPRGRPWWIDLPIWTKTRSWPVIQRPTTKTLRPIASNWMVRQPTLMVVWSRWRWWVSTTLPAPETMISPTDLTRVALKSLALPLSTPRTLHLALELSWVWSWSSTSLLQSMPTGSLVAGCFPDVIDLDSWYGSCQKPPWIDLWRKGDSLWHSEGGSGPRKPTLIVEMKRVALTKQQKWLCLRSHFHGFNPSHDASASVDWENSSSPLSFCSWWTWWSSRLASYPTCQAASKSLGPTLVPRAAAMLWTWTLRCWCCLLWRAFRPPWDGWVLPESGFPLMIPSTFTLSLPCSPWLQQPFTLLGIVCMPTSSVQLQRFSQILSIFGSWHRKKRPVAWRSSTRQGRFRM